MLARTTEVGAWCDDRLRPEHRVEVEGWPATVELAVEGLGVVLFCHGSPRSDEENLTVATSEERGRSALAGVAADVVVCGHTHVQFDRSDLGVRLVNAGSVGLPYEGRPGAFWALLGPDVTLRESGYDVPAAVEQFVATGYPQAADRLGPSLVEPIPAEEAIARYEELAADGGE